MDSAVSQEEKLLFKKLKNIRELVRQISPDPQPEMDRLYIREILYNHLAQKNLSPKPAEFDALADDIEDYINRSFNEFMVHLHKKKV